MQKETWKPIVGYEGLYEVSNMGRIKSLPKTIDIHRCLQHRNEKIFNGSKDNHGYMCVTLCNNGKRKTFKVHRLVAYAFIPNPDNLPQINHKDENKANNCVENLEWCDQSYNINYGNRNKKCILTKNKNGSFGAEVPILQYTFDGVFVKRYSSLSEVERTTGKCYVSVICCCSGKFTHSYDYIWIYEKDVDKLQERLEKIKKKRVVQLNLDGSLVKIWNSVTEASRGMGIHTTSISMCCSGNYKTSCGFKWMKEIDYLKLKNNEQ